LTKLAERLNQRREMIPDEELQEELQQYEAVQPVRRDDEDDTEDNSPLSIVKEIKENPSQKGTFSTIIGGIPVDLHVLEDYLVRTSPFALKTVMRYHNARNMEEIKNYSRGPNIKMNSKTLILIIMLIGVAMLGLFMIMFLPDILQMFSGGL